MYDQPASTLLRAAKCLDAASKKPPLVPSTRDQEIFKRVEIHCERQCALAAELGLDPSRISQIVSSVRRWLAQGGQGDAETLTTLEQRRLARTLAQARHEAIFALVMREAARQENQSQHKTVRARVEDGDEKSVVTTLRDQRLNVQLLKAAQRSAIELERLAEREPIPEPPQSEPSADELYDAVASELFGLHREAQHAGHVPRAHDVHLRRQVENLLASFLGRQPKPETVAEKIRRGIERQEAAANEPRRVPESAADETHQAEERLSPTDPVCVADGDPPVPCASLMHPTSAEAAQHEPASLGTETAPSAAPQVSVNASLPADCASSLASCEKPNEPPPPRKKPPNMSPPPSGDAPQKRRIDRGHEDCGHEDSGQPPDDRIPIVLHAWTYRDGTPIR